jgi:hypothetical protein
LRNQCPNALLVFWLNEAGQEIALGTIGAGAVTDYSTFGGHLFRLRSATTRRYIVDVTMPNANSELTMPYK